MFKPLLIAAAAVFVVSACDTPPPVEGEGERPAEGEGDPLPSEGEGDIVAEGEGDIVAEGEGDIVVGEGEGDIVVGEGEGDIVAGEGEGDIVAGEGEGDIVAGEGEGDGDTCDPATFDVGCAANAIEFCDVDTRVSFDCAVDFFVDANGDPLPTPGAICTDIGCVGVDCPADLTVCAQSTPGEACVGLQPIFDTDPNNDGDANSVPCATGLSCVIGADQTETCATQPATCASNDPSQDFCDGNVLNLCIGLGNDSVLTTPFGLDCAAVGAGFTCDPTGATDGTADCVGCGDGVVQAGEACDLGTAANDGVTCNADCSDPNVDDFGDLATPTPATLPLTQTVDIGRAGADRDCFSFTLATRQFVTFTATTAGCATFDDDPIIEILSGTTSVASDDDTGAGFCSSLQIALDPGAFVACVGESGADNALTDVAVSVVADDILDPLACAAGQARVVVNGGGTPLTIPDNDLTGVTSTATVAATGTVARATVALDGVTHPFVADVGLTLRSPAGTAVLLSDGNGGSNADYTDTVFFSGSAQCTPIVDASAPFTGCFAPEVDLGGVAGEAANGAWRLTAVDSSNLDSGTLDAWRLVLCLNP